MSLYFGATEITGLYFGDTEITGLYFGDTEIWAAWAEYDGTLPATYSANGSTLVDYRIYGECSGVGDDSGTAYGYEVDMCVKSENMYNKNSEGNIRGYISTNGVLHPSTQYGDNVLISEKIPVTPGEKYVMCNAVISGSGNGAAFYNDNDSVVSSFAIIAKQNYTLTAPSNAKYFRSTVIYGSDGNTFMFIAGDEYPSAFIPYSRTNIPIYIGSDPLGEDEYVSFKEQKIYRMSGGVLTPTDPPVALPQLPTVDGTTITDYAGQSAAVPSRFVAKYRKEGY